LDAGVAAVQLVAAISLVAAAAWPAISRRLAAAAIIFFIVYPPASVQSRNLISAKRFQL
jgi:hypothetical protein